jgi:hypothetical protein
MARHDPARALPAQCRLDLERSQPYLDSPHFNGLQEPPMGQLFNWTLAGAVAAVVVTAALIARFRRRRASLPELIKHPERLDEMLDATDDA